MNKFVKIFLAAVLAVFASACEEPVGGGNGEPALNQNLEFTLKLEEVTSVSAKIKVQHNGTSDDMWYGFVTDKKDITSALADKVQELLAADKVSGLKIAANVTITLENLQPETDYTYIAFGCTMEGKAYGKMASLEFTTARDNSVKETSNWKVTYARGENQGQKAELFSVECAKDLTWYMSTVMKDALESNQLQPADYAAYVIETEVPYLLQYYSASQLFITGPETVAYQRMESGDYYAFVIGYDAKGQTTGDYSVVPFTIKEEEASAEYNKWLGTWEVTSTPYTAQKSDGSTYQAKNTFSITLHHYDNNFMYAVTGWECGANQYLDFTTAFGEGSTVAFPVYFENGQVLFQEYGITTLSESADSKTEDLYFGLWGYGKIIYNGKTYDFNPVGNEGDVMAVATTQDGQTGIIDGNHVQGEMDVTYLAMGYAFLPLRQGVSFQYYNDYMKFPISMKKTGSSALAVKSSEPASFKCTDLKVLTMKKAERNYMNF